MSNPFQKAVKEQSKLRLAVSSPAGFGKTYTALRIAKRLAEHCGGRVALIDTEHNSASKYADKFDFDSVELHAPFTPERYIEMIHAAEAAGYPVLILDSASHEWNGAGGCLELVDDIGRRKFNGNKWSAWSEVTPRHSRFIETILASPMHIIATYRSKVETQQVEQNGQKKVVKMGMEAVAREGTDYEFDVVGEIDSAHRMAITKTRCEALTDKEFLLPGEDVADTLIAWLSDGAPIQPKPTPQTAASDAEQLSERPTAAAAPANSTEEPVERPNGNGQAGGTLATPAQLKLIYLTAEKELHITEEELEERCNAQYGRLPLHLTKREASEFIDSLKGQTGQAPAQPQQPAQPQEPANGAEEARRWVKEWLERVGAQETPKIGKRGEELKWMAAHLEGAMPPAKVPVLCKTLHEVFVGENLPDGVLVGEVMDARLILALKGADNAALMMLSRFAKGL